MDEGARAVVWATCGLIFCILLGAGPGYAVMALKATKQWKRLVLVFTGFAMLPGIALCVWSLTLPPESIGWGFLISGSNLIFWPWITALTLGLWHLLLNRKNTR